MKRAFLGIDAGFSATSRSTGVCVIDPGASAPVRALHVKTAEATSAIHKLLDGAEPIAISIDGSLVAGSGLTGAAAYVTVNRYRRCEQLLSGGIFQKRCKPGSTSTPRGLALHHQATFLANHLGTVFPKTAISESFPNAFLGVMLPDSVYKTAIRRGIKSDVFWEECAAPGRPMRRLLTSLLAAEGGKVFRASRKLTNHDERAAFVCALAAAASHQAKAFLVDGGADGAFVLPPERFIQPWALEPLKMRCSLPPSPATAVRN
jgi:hypothetical protein